MKNTTVNQEKNFTTPSNKASRPSSQIPILPKISFLRISRDVKREVSWASFELS